MNDKIIGQRIAHLLSKRGLTQRDLAAAVGVHVNVISYWCRSVRVPSVEQIVIVAKYFGVTSDYLLGLTDVEELNADLQAVCQMTGLSSESVKNISEILTKQDYPGDDGTSVAVNIMLSSLSGMRSLASAISSVMESCEYAKDYLSEDDTSSSRMARDYQIGKQIDRMELSFFKADEAFRDAINKAFKYRQIMDDLKSV